MFAFSDVAGRSAYRYLNFGKEYVSMNQTL